MIGISLFINVISWLSGLLGFVINTGRIGQVKAQINKSSGSEKKDAQGTLLEFRLKRRTIFWATILDVSVVLMIRFLTGSASSTAIAQGTAVCCALISLISMTMRSNFGRKKLWPKTKKYVAGD